MIIWKYILKQVPSEEVEVYFSILFCDNNTKIPYRPNSKSVLTNITIYSGSWLQVSFYCWHLLL